MRKAEKSVLAVNYSSLSNETNPIGARGSGLVVDSSFSVVVNDSHSHPIENYHVFLTTAIWRSLRLLVVSCGLSHVRNARRNQTETDPQLAWLRKRGNVLLNFLRENQFN